MKERPILFSGPMVRALLDGSKTQTRRIVKPTGAHHIFQFRGTEDARGADEPTGEWAWGRAEKVVSEHIRCPYGKPGDRLWVRETHDVRVVGTELFHGDRCVEGIRHYAKVAYRADDGRAEVDIDEATFERLDETESKGWAPSIHMPRWASRLTLEVTGVRVQRLNEISQADAESEGIDFLRHVPDADENLTPRELYMCLWDGLKPSAGAAWADNPWVWVVEFKRVT